MAKHIPRLYCQGGLEGVSAIELAGPQAHYLLNVMRQKPGDRILLFNGRDGEWSACLEEAQRKKCRLSLIKQMRPQKDSADLWLLFAPLKQGRIDYLIEKATELGVGRLCPVLTDHTHVSRIRLDRLQAHAVEAAEQSGRLEVPLVMEAVKLGNLLKAWNTERPILMGDERGKAEPLTDVCQKQPFKSAAILIGPEGGFSEKEFALLEALPFVHPVSLGPRILRADTAALALLSCWQALCGD